MVDRRLSLGAVALVLFGSACSDRTDEGLSDTADVTAVQSPSDHEQLTTYEVTPSADPAEPPVSSAVMLPLSEIGQPVR